jgi:hypothetical protein
MLPSVFWQGQYVQSRNLLEVLRIRRHQNIVLRGSGGCEAVRVRQTMTGF